jgi:hypothetical protein
LPFCTYGFRLINLLCQSYRTCMVSSSPNARQKSARPGGRLDDDELCVKDLLSDFNTQNHVTVSWRCGPRVNEMLLLRSPPGPSDSEGLGNRKSAESAGKFSQQPKIRGEEGGRLGGSRKEHGKRSWVCVLAQARRSACVRSTLSNCPARAHTSGSCPFIPMLTRHGMEGSPDKQGTFRGCTYPVGVRTFVQDRHVAPGTALQVGEDERSSFGDYLNLSMQSQPSTTNAMSEVLWFVALLR